MWALQLLCITNFLELTIASPESHEVQCIFISFFKVSIIYYSPLLLVIFVSHALSMVVHTVPCGCQPLVL